MLVMRAIFKPFDDAEVTKGGVWQGAFELSVPCHSRTWSLRGDGQSLFEVLSLGHMVGRDVSRLRAMSFVWFLRRACWFEELRSM